MSSVQLDLFGEAKVKVEQPEPMTKFQAGKREVQLPLRKQRREAIKRLLELLKEMEGKDIYIGWCGGSRAHFWLDNLKLPRLKLDYYPCCFEQDPNYIPSVIVLWGSRSSQVRIFTDYLTAIREQDYQGYWLYLLDFHNGTWQHPIDELRPHCDCITITRFKD